MWIVDVNEFYLFVGGGVWIYVDWKMGIMVDLGYELIVVVLGKEGCVEECVGGGWVIYFKLLGMLFDDNYGLFWDEGVIYWVFDDFDLDVVECCLLWWLVWFVGDWWGRVVKFFFMYNDNVVVYV